MIWLVHIISLAFIIPGCVFLLAGGYGLIRMPDLYTRLHAASMTDTGATILLIIGMSIEAIFVFNSFSAFVKLILIMLFALFTTPTASHALAKTALMGGLIPTNREGDPMFDSIEDVERLADRVGDHDD